MPGYANPGGGGWGCGPGVGGWRRRLGRGQRGFGYGGGWTPWAGFGHELDAEPRRQALRGRADALRAELQALESRLAEGEENTSDCAPAGAEAVRTRR
jgi:hypothetical protein